MLDIPTLIARLEHAGLAPRTLGSFSDVSIDHLANDSRAVGPRGLFIAIRGVEVDGHLFIDKAVQNGANATVCEAVPEDATARFPGTAFIQVRDTRKALAVLAAAFHGDPALALRIAAITGTNGKTTTAFLMHHLLSGLGESTGLIGTIAYRFGGAPVTSTHTTPDALNLHHMFRQMVDAGCTACAMEASSHALQQARLHGVPIEVALFSNLTRDHLDYHGTFDEYLAAKKILFDGLAPSATALYNLDDEAGPAIVADTRGRRVSYGRHADADLRLEVLENAIDGLRLRIDGRARKFRLVGLFNAYNLTAAYGAGRALGYDADAVLDVLAAAPPVPGRFEQFTFNDGTTVIVDYAHTPDALENVLHTIQALRPSNARIWCVFGCGGDRDPAKRRMMGALAEHLADEVIVTSDNPRTEEPETIMNAIRRGMDQPTAARWILDRGAAIQAAATHAAPGDVVLVAGKGHETYQIIGKTQYPFDDREEVRTRFAARGLKT